MTERGPRSFANGSEPADTRFVTTTAYNTLCGAPSSETDINGIVTTASYDALCRLTQVQNTATGHYKSFAYVNEGNAATQHLLVKEPLPNAAGEGQALYRYDGRGRIWRTETRGETLTGAARLVDTDYDRRSNVLRKSHAYFAGQTPQWTTTTYDWADRPLTVTNPDGSDRAFSYGLIAMLANTDNVPLTSVQLTDELDRVSFSYTSTLGDVRQPRILLKAGLPVEFLPRPGFLSDRRRRDEWPAARMENGPRQSLTQCRRRLRVSLLVRQRLIP